jgi:hypothetical protein
MSASLFWITLYNAYLKWQKMASDMSSAVRETLKPTISRILVRSAMASFT